MLFIKKNQKGIHPNYLKELSQDAPIEKAIDPDIVYIPLLQHLGAFCKPLVSVGNQVCVGTKIGEADSDSGFWAPVHSSVSGKVKAIERFYHPLAGTVETIIIENDKKGTKDPSFTSSSKVDALSKEEIVAIVKDKGLVGMGGAGFPTYVKLSSPKKICTIDTLLINGAECEPYLTCDYRLMIEKSEQIIQGIILIKNVLGVKDVYIGIEQNKPLALVKMTESAVVDDSIKVVSLPTIYPQGGEKTLIKTVLGREVPSKKLPLDAGVVVQNIGTAFAMYNALYLGEPLIERVVTITGPGVSIPKNLLTRIGTPIKDLIEQCGGMRGNVKKIISGGPMMGVSQYTVDIPVIKTMSGIVLFDEKHAYQKKIKPCIRCGRCVDVCPQNLMPCVITNAAERDLFDISDEYNIADCVECGCCAYVCPSKRPLVHLLKYGKRKLRMRYERT